MPDEVLLRPWLDLASEALVSFDERLDWSLVSALLVEQMHAAVAGSFEWEDGAQGRVAPYPTPTFDLEAVAARAPGLHPLARHYARHGCAEVLTIDEVPTCPDEPVRAYVAELTEHGIEQHLWIPLPAVGGVTRVCGACRPSERFSAADRAHAVLLQRLLASLVLHGDLLARWRADHLAGPGDGRVAAAEDLHLTPREMEVLGLCADGLTTAAAGRRLGIAPKTADKHLENAYRKLGVRDRVSAVRRAGEAGLLGSSLTRGGAAARSRHCR